MSPIVATYLALLTAPIGAKFFLFPYVYVRTPWGPAQMVYNDEFTPP